MDELLKEIDDRIEAGKAEIRATSEKIHAYQWLLDFQEETVNDLNTARRVLEKINAQTANVQLGEDRDH